MWFYNLDKVLNCLICSVLILSVNSCEWYSEEESLQSANLTKKNSQDFTNFYKEGVIIKPEEEEKLPVFNYRSLEGELISSESMKDEVIFLNFWATWCVPCREEMPTMEELYHQLKDRNFQMLAVSVGESPDEVKAFLKNYPYSFPIAIDEQQDLREIFNVIGLPTTFFYKSNGALIGYTMGGREWTKDIYHRFFQNITVKVE